MHKQLLVLATVLLTSGTALADDWGVGFRVGGYGFREVSGGTTTWDDCRMDGVGLFGERRFGRHFFAEAGVDQYNATADTVSHEAMDRVSTHVTAVAGVRAPYRWVSPYVQAGAGVEFTSVSMMDHAADHVLPTGFIGLGADLRLTSHLKAGMNIRFHMMGHFDHHDADMAVSAAPASQAQFFLRYDL